MYEQPNFFSCNGRIRRRDFNLIYLPSMALLYIFSILAEEMVFVLIVNLIIILLLIPTFIKRCHDMGDSGWWTLCPVYNALFMMFMDGTDGVNKYGPDPKGRVSKEQQMKAMLMKSQGATDEQIAAETGMTIAQINDCCTGIK